MTETEIKRNKGRWYLAKHRAFAYLGAAGYYADKGDLERAEERAQWGLKAAGEMRRLEGLLAPYFDFSGKRAVRKGEE